MSDKVQITIIINSRPFSINQYYYYPVLKTEIHAYNAKRKARIYGKPVRSADARNWARSVFTELNKSGNKAQLKKFRDSFDPKLHTIGIKLACYYENFTTKAGIISSKTNDCSNVEKPIIDLLFDEKYYGRSCPEGCENLNINDKFITELISSKHQSDENDYVVITIYTKNLPSCTKGLPCQVKK